jgi:dienelactone hydrolase
MYHTKRTRFLLLAVAILLSVSGFAQLVLNTANANSLLYLGSGTSQPLIVGLGGSEGGNAWASNHWKDTRDQFIAKGYAFLALGYFGTKGTPDTLDGIAIENIHSAILEAAKNPSVNPNKIAIVGGSRGADLALLLGSYYTDISCVVAIVPSHVSFPGHTSHFTTSCWVYNGQQLPFVPLSEDAVPSLMKGDLQAAFSIMLKDSVAEAKAFIPVEKINGPVLLLSATKDEIIPSQYMCEKMMARLKANQFKHYYQHMAIEGSHAAPLQHFAEVFEFLHASFPAK